MNLASIAAVITGLRLEIFSAKSACVKAIKHRRIYLRGAFLDRPIPESVIKRTRRKLAE